MDVKENVQANERRVLESLRLVDRVARLRLEHGRRILAVDSPGLFGPADALVTTQPDLVLWLTVADCYPLVLASGDALLLGHCGWRGVAAGLVEAMVEKLLETSRATGKSSRGSPARAWIGPGIGRCCYPVGAEVAERFPRSSTPMSDPGAGRSGGRVHLDLAREIALRLLACGLPATAIAASGACTSCQVRRFFSHRRDGAPTGRMAALCWRNPPAPEK
jgi:YfiH family protein